MTSEELMEKAWKTIRECTEKTTKEEEEAADKVLEKVPEFIKESISKRLRIATVIYLGEKSLEALKNYQETQEARKKRDFFPLSDILDEIKDQARKRHDPTKMDHILVGVDLVIYNKLRDAKLNPYVAPDPKGKWGIGIQW